MKRFVIIYGLIVFFHLSTSAFYKKDSLRHIELNRMVFGSEISVFYSNIVDPSTNKKYIDFLYRIEPEASIYLNINIGLGVKGIYDYGRSNYRSYNKLYGLGTFLRYYYPLHFKNEKLKGLNNRFIASIEFSYNRTNYFVNSIKEDPIPTSPFNVNLYRIPVGLSIRIWKEFFGKIALRPEFYRPGGNLLTYQLGFEYHIKY
ncbi:MAG: hypothetical protein JXR64_09060 [Spirochaetales bacterium]|nr:hypothetical protein [Spirochaetales bacterium]